MQRVTVTLDDDLMAELDRVIAMKGYQNRSEAIRDLARAGIREAVVEVADNRNCVAALVYVYNHAARELSKRLVQTYHDHHDLSLATMHVHLDHDNCMEVTVLKGATSEVQHVAEHVIAERGVRHGRLIVVPADVELHSHGHGNLSAHKHAHIKVR
jgi:CopG family nickel-responsive transcriptional regulator